MTENKKRKLVNESKGATLESIPCSVGGWKNKYATLSPHCGGFWHTDWETVERILKSDKNFRAEDVTFSSWIWLGFGVEYPKSLMALVPPRYLL